MWLLNTVRAELSLFPGPAAVPGGYAFLSHTWMGEEQSFQDVQALRKMCSQTGGNPRDHVSEKIRRCCVLAEDYGHEWVWIDSCCIDKTSSTELSEAINSMFDWYVLSEICFAYLEDVPTGDDIHSKRSAFRQARWHKRGWTLQALIAPTFLVFLSRDWARIGTKLDLASLLREITGIHPTYLTRRLPFHKASIAVRMSWASRRNTTRLEDEAYCLLGLFNIKMSILYGEGRQAFRRLQEELSKQSPDTTLFFWSSGDIHTKVQNVQSAEPLGTIWSNFNVAYHADRFLFAPSPQSFQCSSVVYTPALPRGDSGILQPYMRYQWSHQVRTPVSYVLCLSACSNQRTTRAVMRAL